MSAVENLEVKLAWSDEAREAALRAREAGKHSLPRTDGKIGQQYGSKATNDLVEKHTAYMNNKFGPVKPNTMDQAEKNARLLGAKADKLTETATSKGIGNSLLSTLASHAKASQAHHEATMAWNGIHKGDTTSFAHEQAMHHARMASKHLHASEPPNVLGHAHWAKKASDASLNAEYASDKTERASSVQRDHNHAAFLHSDAKDMHMKAATAAAKSGGEGTPADITEHSKKAAYHQQKADFHRSQGTSPTPGVTAVTKLKQKVAPGPPQMKNRNPSGLGDTPANHSYIPYHEQEADRAQASGDMARYRYHKNKADAAKEAQRL